MENKDYMKVIYMQFVIIICLIVVAMWPEIECSFEWPDVGFAGEME